MGGFPHDQHLRLFFSVSSGAIGPAFYILSMEFDKSIARTTELLTYVVLLAGLGVRIIPASPKNFRDPGSSVG